MCPPSPCPNEQHDTDNQDCCDDNRPNHRRIKRDAENEIRVRSVCVHGVCSWPNDVGFSRPAAAFGTRSAASHVRRSADVNREWRLQFACCLALDSCPEPQNSSRGSEKYKFRPCLLQQSHLSQHCRVIPINSLTGEFVPTKLHDYDDVNVHSLVCRRHVR